MTPYAELLLDALDKKLLGMTLASIYRRDRSVPAVFLLCTHEWGNIGDLAINYNEITLLEKVFPEHAVFALSRSALAANWQRVRAAIDPDDLIVVHGGGNLGDVWPHEEAARLAVIAAFGRNRIISMPQSIHFTDSQQLRHSMNVYQRHPRLLLAVRDDRSAEIALAHLDASAVIRTEDVVTRHDFPYAFRPTDHRTLFVGRDDTEKHPSSGIDRAHAALIASGARVESTDTVVPKLPFSNAELAAKLVYQKIDEMHSADVIVTDRLHGALFALIAGRPVVVFDTASRKIGGALQNLLPALGAHIHFAPSSGHDVSESIIAMAGTPSTELRPKDVLADAHRQFEMTIRHFATH